MHRAAHFSAPHAAGSKEKRFRPRRATAHKDESVTKLPWYHLGLLSPHRDSLTAAAFCNATTGRCNGRSRRRLSTLALRPRGSETIFSSLFPALFHRPGSLEGSMRKPTLLFTAIFVILVVFYPSRRDLSTLSTKFFGRKLILRSFLQPLRPR